MVALLVVPFLVAMKSNQTERQTDCLIGIVRIAFNNKQILCLQ